MRVVVSYGFVVSKPISKNLSVGAKMECKQILFLCITFIMDMEDPLKVKDFYIHKHLDINFEVVFV